jgi:phenylalanyl-tRNA synthetase beta chain
MRISLNWLKEFVSTPDDASRLGERLSLAGLAVDTIEENGDDVIFDLDITTNRGDCLSHLGVARELATLYGTDLNLPQFEVAEIDRPVGAAFSISIADEALCKRYCGRYIEGVTIGQSPDWLVQRIEALGIRSINNVADITNYVLMELGHPLHAFDSDTLAGNQIIVRRAEVDEALTTLDGEKRELAPSMVVIADAKRAVALAGIMGGEETEISASTKNVLLEAAWFDPLSIRKTARAVNLSTEASYRFERGADIAMARAACDRAAQLIAEIAGGRIYEGVLDVYPSKTIAKSKARLRRTRIREYLGMEIPDIEVTHIFSGLGFDVGAGADAEGWSVDIPTHRHDVSGEEDLLEEVARIYGYDRFPSTLPACSGHGERLPWQAEETRIRDLLSGMGYSEACSIAFSDRETEERFAPEIEPVILRNPLSEEAPILRTSLVPSMLRSLQWNLNRGVRNVLLYEIGKVYPASGEYRQLLIAQTGAVRPGSIHHAAFESDFYNLKGNVETLLGGFSVNTDLSPDDPGSYYHPGRSIQIGSVATLGELDQSAVDLFKLRQKVYIAEIAIEELFTAGLRNVAAAVIPKYPAIRHDLSLLLDRKIRYSDVLTAVRASRIPELVTVDPFDRLDTGSFPESCYSLAVGLVYQSSKRTLTDEEVQEFDRKILDQLEGIGVKLRS